ncbi:MAG: uroporphyrinogen decarboxylase family protein [Anaerolineae bacterium]
MTSRERLRAAINHRQPDRVPLDLGATPVTGIAAGAYACLRRALHLPEKPVKVDEPFQVLAQVDDDIREALGVDTVGLSLPVTFFGFRNEDWKPWQLFDGTPVLVPSKFMVRPDDRGDLLLYPGGDTTVPPSARMPYGGYYFDAIVRQEPIDWERMDPAEWVEQMYSVYSDEDLHYLEAEARRLYETTDRAIVALLSGAGFGDIAHVPGPWLAHPKGIRDPQEWYVAHATHPEYIHGIFARQCDIALENARLLWQAVGSKVDVVFVSGTDLGSQDRAFLAPAMYRSLYKPFHQRVNEWIHRHTTWKVFFHTCGSIVELLDDLVEAGVDIINPVQCSAKGMDPAFLKREYGDRLVFWGGGVDTQGTLPFGTPEQVYEQVRERIRVLAPGGGFVFNTIHNIQQTVPVENLLALFQALRDSSACSA